MTECVNCHNLNDSTQRYCQQCGTPLPQRAPRPHRPQNPPRPYSWASDSSSLNNIELDSEKQTKHLTPAEDTKALYTPPSAAVAQTNVNSPIFNDYRCPRCGTTAAPKIKKRVSETGWIVLVLMIFFCLPLFWVGLLITEEQSVCPACQTKIG